jgi:cation/acetate symporter
MQAANNPLAVTFFFIFMALTLGITYWAARRTRSPAARPR